MSAFDRKIRTTRESTIAPPASRQQLYSRYLPSGVAPAASLESRIKGVYPTVNARPMAVPRYPEHEEEESYEIAAEHYSRSTTASSSIPSTTLPTKLSGGYTDLRRVPTATQQQSNSLSSYSSYSSPTRVAAAPAQQQQQQYEDDEPVAPSASLLTADASLNSAMTQMSNKGFDPRAPLFSVSMNHLFHPAPWMDINRLPLALRNGITYLSLMRFPRTPKTTERYLPPQTKEDRGKPTLVLDLDETLMHCSAERLPGAAPDLIVRFDDCSSVGYVYFRPFVKVFLENTAKLFELVIFTASTQPYADQVLAKLDPTRRLIRHRLYRPHCSEIGGGYTKDLRLLGRDLSKTMLLDNSPISLALQLDNGIFCESYFGNNPQDTELVKTLQLLQQWLESRQPCYKFLAERYGLRAWVNSMRLRDALSNMIC